MVGGIAKLTPSFSKVEASTTPGAPQDGPPVSDGAVLQAALNEINGFRPQRHDERRDAGVVRDEFPDGVNR